MRSSLIIALFAIGSLATADFGHAKKPRPASKSGKRTGKNKGKAAKADPPVLIYQGRLQDAKGKPIGGVFPLTFGVYRTARGGKAVWSESHFVAVDGGSYSVELGHKRPMRGGIDLSKSFLSVAITGGDEVVRERLDADSVKEATPEPLEIVDDAPPATTRPTTRPTKRGKDGRTVVSYAETAGEAYEAHHAKEADKVGKLTEKDILDKLKKQAKAKVTIGTTKRYTASAGGEGGIHYELRCPKGHVVTGVRGGSGLYLDSITLICQPLE